MQGTIVTHIVYAFVLVTDNHGFQHARSSSVARDVCGRCSKMGCIAGNDMKLCYVHHRAIHQANDSSSAIFVLQLYAWETAFGRKIRSIRDKELFHMRRALYVKAIVRCGILYPRF